MRSAVRILLVVCVILVISGVPMLEASEPSIHAGDAPADGAVSHEEEGHGEHHNITHRMMLLAFQLGVIIIAAKLGGELFMRLLKMPAVLGELAAGLVIGPYALGAIALPVIGPLFPAWQAGEVIQVVEAGKSVTQVIVPISDTIYGISTFAALVLLFLAGLETDFKQFIKYAGPGGLVGLGGVLGAFLTGDLLTVMFGASLGNADWTFMSPVPLFMGTISVATSVGITARVLSEKGKLDTPEGVTILSGAVIDDVLGIIVLAIVIALGKAANAGTDEVDWGAIGVIAVKAVVIWLGTTALLIALAKPFKKLLGYFRGDGTVPGVALGVALIVSGVMESAGLAMIIGAYVTGLALAKESDLAHRLDGLLRPMYNIIVPVFFCAMGMLVDFGAMADSLVFGIVFSVVAIVSKVVGCGLPTFLVKFNLRGALRVGFGMLPRGEVALIIAGVGLTTKIIGADMFGVAIMMTLITTVMAPPILVKLFDGGPGIRGEVEPEKPSKGVVWQAEIEPPRRLEVVVSGVMGALNLRDDLRVARVASNPDIFLVTSDVEDDSFDFEIVKHDDVVEVHAQEADRDRALHLVQDALVYAKGAFDTLLADTQK